MQALHGVLGCDLNNILFSFGIGYAERDPLGKMYTWGLQILGNLFHVQYLTHGKGLKNIGLVPTQLFEPFCAAPHNGHNQFFSSDAFIWLDNEPGPHSVAPLVSV
ncbi:hypothetical protein VNO77_20300 [Canavalia gladiata]|uniref:Uncharacterized protein n=1 Tax=Canavalia gladiata TaxID=3824 RepID=A0AAN9LT74_CANGL